MSMQSKICIVLVFCCVASSVHGWVLNDTVVRSVGLGSQFNIIYPVTFENLTISTDSIRFAGLNSSNPLGDGNYSIVLNFSEVGVNYSGSDLPYAVQTMYLTTISSGLAGNTSVSFGLLNGVCTAVYALRYESASHNFDRNTTVIGCDGEYAVMNLTLEYGLNYLRSYYGAMVNVEFRHEVTGLLVNDTNITIHSIGRDYSYARNDSTGSGNLSIYLPSPSEYVFRYSGGVYPERFYFIDVSTNATMNLILYVNENTTVSTVTVTILDQNADFVPDALVKMYRYDIDTNSYLLVEEGETNFVGQTKLRVELGVEFYKFLIYVGDVLKKETTPTYLYETSLNIYIDLSEGIGTIFKESEGVSHSLIFQEANSRFRLFYDDSADVGSRVCLNVYSTISNSRVLMNQSCSTVSSAFLYAGVSNVSGRSYLAQVTVDIDGEEEVITELWYTYGSEGRETFGKSGLFLLILLTLTVVGLGASYRASVAVWLAPLPLLMLVALKVVTVNIGIALGLQVIAIIIGALMEARRYG